jgi:hypothetical protein
MDDQNIVGSGVRGTGAVCARRIDSQPSMRLGGLTGEPVTTR